MTHGSGRGRCTIVITMGVYTVKKDIGSTVGATVTLAEAAILTNRPQSTIRDWMRKGIIVGKQDQKGKWHLDRTTVIAAAATAPTAARTVAAQSQKTPSAASTVVTAADPTVARYIDSLQETVLREREENRELRSRIRELEQERTQHLAEMRAILSKDSQNKEGVISRWIRR